MHSIEELRRLTVAQRDAARLVDPDSVAYALIGKKCFFCKTKITKKDVTPPNECAESSLGHVTHGNCLNYIMAKYHDKRMVDLEGKVVRMRVEGTNVGVAL
ncbi:MAG: hypothetical protein MPJ22_00365 [Pirellulales bacterium]|nr:hypothetical protein [Pirellulales bacterium]